MAKSHNPQGANPGVSQTLLDYPLGVVAIRTFLWLVSVMALLGVLTLLVLRPSLVFTSDSSVRSASKELDSPDSPVGAVCSFPNLEN
jgi:hypothetical protein